MLQAKDAHVGDRVYTVIENYLTGESRRRSAAITDVRPNANVIMVRFDDDKRIDCPMLPQQLWLEEEATHESAA